MGWILEASALIGRRKPCDGEAILQLEDEGGDQDSGETIPWNGV